MGRVSVPEIILILLVFLLLFGPSKLPEMGKSLGRAIGEFKKALRELAKDVTEDKKSGPTI